MSDIRQAARGDADDRQRIRTALAEFLAGGGPRHSHVIDDPGPPVPQATMSGSPRAVLTLSGTNIHDVPSPAGPTRIAVPAGDLAFITARAWNRPTWEHRYSFLTIDWRNDHVRYYLRVHTRPLAADGEHWIHLHPTPASSTRSLVQACADLCRHGDVRARHGALCALIVQAQWDLEHGSDHDDPTWERVRDWVDDHLHLPITRTAVAKACRLHPNSISRLFLQHTQVHFIAYLTRLRLDRARSLLKTYNLSIAEVARASGFQSAEYFCNVFRRAHGSSPSRWVHQQTT